jgi:hypothetical protein
VFEGRVFPVPASSKRSDRPALPAPARFAKASNEEPAPPLEARTLRRFAVAPRNQSCDMVGLAHAAARAYEENLALAK